MPHWVLWKIVPSNSLFRAEYSSCVWWFCLWSSCLKQNVLSAPPLSFHPNTQSGPVSGPQSDQHVVFFFPATHHYVDHIALIIELLGSVPRKLIMNGKYSKDFFTKKGKKTGQEIKDFCQLTFLCLGWIIIAITSLLETGKYKMWCIIARMPCFELFISCVALRQDCVFGLCCRWFETHHQAEAVGPARGSGREVRVVPRRGRLLHRLPSSHAGAGSREKSHGCGVLAPPLAVPLVDPSSHCTSPFLLISSRLQQITFPLWAYQIIYFFVSLVYVPVIELLLLCTFAFGLFVVPSVWLHQKSSGFVWFVVMFGSGCCSLVTPKGNLSLSCWRLILVCYTPALKLQQFKDICSLLIFVPFKKKTLSPPIFSIVLFLLMHYFISHM